MEANHLNSEAWAILNHWGWWFWGINFVLSIVMAILLMMLDGPYTMVGRYIRVATWFSIVPLWFSPWFNVLGAIAQPLIMAAFCSVVGQIAYDCRQRKKAERRYKVRNTPVVEKVLNTLVMR